MVFEN